MKRPVNAFLALFFIITTLTTSLHELLPHHNSADCQVCTLVQHDNGLAPQTCDPLGEQEAPSETIAPLILSLFPTTITSWDARAPPSIC